jgi:hypothetical protein
MKEQTHTTWFNQQATNFEHSRFGAMTVMMTAQSCLGSIAAMMALMQDNYGVLMLITTFTTASNSAFIAQSPAKWCLGLFYSSVAVSALSILILLFI